MEPKTGKRLTSLTNFFKSNIRRIIIIIVAVALAQLAGVPINISAYPTDRLYPLAFLPLIFIAGGGGMAGLVGYAIGGTAGDLVKFGYSLTLIFFDIFAFGFAGWVTGIAMKGRSGIGQVILTIIATLIAGGAILFLSPIGVNIGRGVDYNTLYSRYLYGWLPFFIVPAAILSYWMKRIRSQLTKILGTTEVKEKKKEK
jgi:hypothetical protein